jgi:hypothetical protein
MRIGETNHFFRQISGTKNDLEPGGKKPFLDSELVGTARFELATTSPPGLFPDFNNLLI